jgi:ABC-type dipeptide/oligopeptide/nickel transport system permease subunit
MSVQTLETKHGTVEIPPGDSSWAIARRQFKKDGVAVFAFVFLIGVGAVSVFSPILANSKPIVASYQDGLYFPAFKDYLDENIPIPWLGGWLRKTVPSVFSPKYPSIERPGWQQVPDWGAIRREIDTSDKGWYLLPPVPYYYNEDSSGIKLLPGTSLANLELAADPTDGLGAETLEFVPRRPAGQEMAKILRRAGPNPGAHGALVYDDTRNQWTVEDPTTIDLVRDWGEGWEEAATSTPTPRLTTWHSTDDKHAAGVSAGWEWREAYLAEDQKLKQTPRAAERAARFWARHNESEQRFTTHAWTTLGSWPALESTFEPTEKDAKRLVGAEATASTLWLIFAPDRVFSVLVSAPVRRREFKGSYTGALYPTLLEEVRSAIALTPPPGNTTVNGKAVTGRAFLNTGDAVSLSGVKTTFAQQAPFILGSDSHGRCVLSRLIHGTVIAGSVGLVSVGIYVTIGVILGALAGFYRGWVDLVISRVIEVVICFPTLFLIIMIVGVLQEPSIYLIMIALGLIRWTGVARLVRGEILKTMSEEYVSAAKAMGLPTTRIIFRHILPNSIAPVFVSASFGVAGAILVESSLSFLGFGVAPPTASWGEILRQGKEFVNEGMYHLVWAPGICIFVTVTMFNLVGEGLRDALDPKLRR